MRRNDKFRFSLQWGADSAEKLQAGMLLEKLGNKKSDFIVLAVSEYIERHPEVAAPGAKIEITYQAAPIGEQLREMVMSMARAAVDELMAGKTIVSAETDRQAQEQEGPSEQDLDAMVAGLQLFEP